MEQKDDLIGLLQERFTGHEVEAPPGAWEAISTQLTVGSGVETLRETLQEKFSGHEVDVDPGVWQGISSQLGHGVAAAGGIGAGWLAAGVAAVALTGGLLYWAMATDAPVAQAEPVPAEMIVPAPATVTTEPAIVAQVPATEPATIATPAVVPAVKTSAQPKASVPTRPAPAQTTPAMAVPQGTGMGQATAEPKNPGTDVVNSVLQQLVSQNTTKPEPEHTETVPPPAPKDMPDATVQPKVEAPVAADPVPVQPEVLEPNFFIPNVFSPNGDGVNERLEVRGGPFREVRVRIISAKTNTLVFSANTLDESWDGKVGGAPAEEGYYFYAIEVVGEDGRTYSKGEVVRLFIR